MPTNGYPKFPRNQFPHVDKSLSVVDYYLKAKEAEDTLEKASRDYAGAIDSYSKSNAAMYDIMVSRIVALTTPQEGVEVNKKAKEAAIASGIERVRHATRMNPESGLAKKEVKDVLLSILPLFCTFDKEGFAAAAAGLITDGEALSKLKSKIGGSKGLATGRLNTAMADWEGVFSDTKFLDNVSKASRDLKAYEEAKRFVEQWRHRARLFMQPVTIEGTLISSLPVEIRTVWASAYKRLGFDAVRHTDTFTPFKHSEAISV